MYDRILNRMRRLVVERRYIVTAHAYDEMIADEMAIWDVESVILTGEDRGATEGPDNIRKQVSYSRRGFGWIHRGRRREVRCHGQTRCYNRLWSLRGAYDLRLLR